MKQITFFICTLFCGLNCKTDHGHHHSADIPKIDAQMEEYLTAQAKHFRFNGNVLVAEKGAIIFQKSYGYADFGTKRMLNDSSVFELASVSKQFTATAILLLKDRGQLKLSDTLRQYFPELPYNDITLYHLLTHTSGLPDYEEAMRNKWDQNKIASNKDMIDFLAKEKLPVLFKPGIIWEYSNTAYAILASIVEKVSGQTFSAFMTQNIFQPLDMDHTRIYNTRRSLKDTIPNYAYGFVYNDSLQQYFLPDSISELKFVIYLDGIQGDGVVNSTTTDLLKWDRALVNNTLLSVTAQKEMLKEQELMDTMNNLYYGFGVGMGKSELGYVISHSGGWPGYVTNLARLVDQDQTFIVLSNTGANSPAITLALQHLVNGKPLAMPYAHLEIDMDSTAIQKFAGTYKSTTEMRLENRGDKLLQVSPSGYTQELKPESATKFFYNDGSDRQIEFELNASQQVIKAWMINYGVKTAWEKI